MTSTAPKKVGAPAKHIWRAPSDRMTTPNSGPGYTPMKLPAAASQPTRSNDWRAKHPPYTCPELRPFDGRPGANDHMQHGSLRNGVAVPYAPPAPQCTGTKGVMTYGK
jgi:hypothetical protein